MASTDALRQRVSEVIIETQTAFLSRLPRFFPFFLLSLLDHNAGQIFCGKRGDWSKTCIVISSHFFRSTVQRTNPRKRATTKEQKTNKTKYQTKPDGRGRKGKPAKQHRRGSLWSGGFEDAVTTAAGCIRFPNLLDVMMGVMISHKNTDDCCCCCCCWTFSPHAGKKNTPFYNSCAAKRYILVASFSRSRPETGALPY